MITNVKEYLKNNIVLIGLIIALLLGIILRFKGLTFQSHWVDELFSAYISNPSNSFSYMYHKTVSDVHPPLYQSLLWLWYHIFGFNEIAGRSLSAVVGSLSIYAIYLLGKELFNSEIGLYAAIITSMNQFLIFYSQEVRSYSLLFLLSIVSYLYFVKVLTNYSQKNFVLYLFFTIALVYTHYFGFFLVVTQVIVFIYFFIKEKQQRKHLAILASITAVVLLITLLPLVEYIMYHEGKKSFWIKEPSDWFVVQYLKAYVKNYHLQGVFLLMISFTFAYLFKKTDQEKFKSMYIILLIWIIVGYLLPYIRSITAIPLLTARNTIIIVPALILLISYGIFLLKDNLLKISTVFIIIYLSSLNYIGYYHKIGKQQWREVLVEVDKAKGNIPVYDIFFDPIVKDTYGYKTYTSLLNLDLQILDSKELKKQYNNGTLPNCFFIVDSHGDHISSSKILKDKDIKKVFEIRKHRAKGILYAYRSSLQACNNLYTEANIKTE